MHFIRRKSAGWFLLALASLVSTPAKAEVVRLEVISRTHVAGYDYEKVVGRLHLAVDPKHALNRVIVDLNKAQTGSDGRVEFSADFYMLKPLSGGNGAVLVDIVNRGRLTFGHFNAPAPTTDPIGDGFLMKRGFTVVALGWEFDVAAGNDRLRLDAPIPTDNGKPITGTASALFVPDGRDAMVVNALGGYKPLDPDTQDSVLTVRDSLSSSATTIPRSQWTITSTNRVTIVGGFGPGRMYELSYKAANPPVAGLGFAAVRDVVSWLRSGAEEMMPAKYAYAFGESQSGRYLREFLYEGFNTDERGSRVFDGMMVHIAGAGRLDLNSRWSTPVECCSTYATSFPFSIQAQKDPVSGLTEGLLDNDRARSNQPKLFLTNTGVEYWSSGGRAAALTHTTPDGARDLAQPDNVRIYLMAGTQHGTGPFPPVHGNGQELLNPTNQSWVLRALLVAMDSWVRNGIQPPASRHPQLDQGTLVDASRIAFPSIPGVHSPSALTAGARIANPFLKDGAGTGAHLRLLVPQVDVDGNERSGIRLPEIAVPLATYTGWNFRAPAVGAPDHLYPLLGSYIPFARTKAEREERRDPRPSVAERYPTREAYLAKIRAVTSDLVKDRYLLPQDVDVAVSRANAHWDLVTGTKLSSQ
jgi:hypothetical protein